MVVTSNPWSQVQVRPRLQVAVDQQAPAAERSWWGNTVETFKDLKEATSLLVGGALYLRNKKQAIALEDKFPPLADVSNVKLDRALVICPGWNTELHKFDYLTHKLLASGENGPQAVYLKEGQAFQNPECSIPLEQIPSNSKVFVNIWDSVKTPPDQTATQLKQNLAVLQSAIQADKVDVVGYSMGGLATRKFLDEGGRGIGKFMMLGTPNQGTRFAQMASRVVERDIQWALNFAGLNSGDAPPLKWLAQGSPKLEQLNQRWPQQLAQVDEAVVVGGRSELTPSKGWLPFTKGDGLVEIASLSLPNIPTRVLEGSPYLHHGALPHDSQVFGEMVRFFDFESLPGSTHTPAPVRPKAVPSTPYGEI